MKSFLIGFFPMETHARAHTHMVRTRTSHKHTKLLCHFYLSANAIDFDCRVVAGCILSPILPGADGILRVTVLGQQRPHSTVATMRHCDRQIVLFIYLCARSVSFCSSNCSWAFRCFYFFLFISFLFDQFFGKNKSFISFAHLLASGCRSELQIHVCRSEFILIWLWGTDMAWWWSTAEIWRISALV